MGHFGVDDEEGVDGEDGLDDDAAAIGEGDEVGFEDEGDGLVGSGGIAAAPEFEDVGETVGIGICADPEDGGIGFAGEGAAGFAEEKGDRFLVGFEDVVHVNGDEEVGLQGAVGGADGEIVTGGGFVARWCRWW